MTPTHFYVSMIDGTRKALLLGPYATKEEAEANVSRGKELAEARDLFACFYAFGTAGSDGEFKTVFGN